MRVACVLVQMTSAGPHTPYQRIAASLRARIEAGELRPGDAIPSTRALAKKWKVALATAAHALNALAAEGWVKSVPRVGTVVATTKPAPAKAEPTPHSATPMQDRIVRAAIAIADSEGIAALSLRGVAARIETPVMSLYRHVENKEQLFQLMTENVLAEERFPAQPPDGWRARLEIAAQLQWRILRRHPWLARLMNITRPRPLSGAIVHAEWVLAALALPGLSATLRMQLHITLYGFIQGMAVNLESEADELSESGLSEQEWMDSQIGAFEALAQSGRYPAFASTLAELTDGFELDFDAQFELGLRALLDGFAVIITAAERAARTSSPQRPRRKGR